MSKAFLAQRVVFRYDLTDFREIHDLDRIHPGNVAIAATTPPTVYLRYPCCGDLIDMTGGPHQILRDGLDRIAIRPSIACSGCGAHYIVTFDRIYDGAWKDPARAAEWSARYPDPPMAIAE